MRIINSFKEFLNRLNGQAETLKSLGGAQATKLLVLSAVIGIGMAGIEFFFAFYLQNFFSRLGLVTVPTTFTNMLPINPLYALVALLIAGLIRFIFQALKLYSARLAQQSFSNTQRSRIIEYHLRQSRLTSASETLALFNDEVQRGSLAFLNLSSFFISFFSTIFLFLALMFTQSYAAVLSLIFLIFLYLPTKFITHHASKQGQSLSSNWSHVNSFFIDGIRNNFYLRLYSKIDSTIALSQKHLDLYFETFKKTFLILAIKSTFPSFIGLLLVTIVGYTQIEILKNNDPGSLLIFFYLFLRFSQETSTALTSYSEFTLHSLSLKNILAWYRKLATRPSKPFELKVEKYKNVSSLHEEIIALDCKNISFSYEKTDLIIKDLSVSLKRGDCLVIMGPSGSGKSTLLSLLLGLEKPTSGNILVNHSLSSKNFSSSFYDRVGYVGPVPFLISGTLRDNLLYAHPNPASVTDDSLFDALKLVYLYDFFSNFSKGLDTALDEEGATLSSGQKQRIMFARALIRNPDILILDESTANLDVTLEEKILDNLVKIRNNTIIVVVSHRDSFKRLSTQFLKF